MKKLDESIRDISEAEAIWRKMSPLDRYKLIDRLPYVAGVAARTNACIRYISAHGDEF